MYCQYHGRNVDNRRCQLCPQGDFKGKDGRCSKEGRIPQNEKPKPIGRNVKRK